MIEEKHFTIFCFIVCVYLITCNLMLSLNLPTKGLKVYYNFLVLLYLLSLLFTFNYFEIFFIYFQLLRLLELMM